MPSTGIMLTLALAQLVVTISLAYFLYDANRKYIAMSTPASEIRLPSFTDDELMVMKYLLEKDGQALQASIGKDLNIPKASLSRMVKRLAENGLLAVEKRGRYNYVLITNREYVEKIIRSSNNEKVKQ
ncbi:hypothetical protein GCM10007981_06570 [Thermocladium modestius]|uniref:DUF7343 domain-containing protein n=1 Tax=Thermocladium modestius TaxID=62609 RepID=A0A830GV02_9CREN|nr:helix-turn-helix domain-containing protein [Thermocladium modestius]GGP20052.1 hypothetical protein GCM10007981_06570 [Thermocladium modestius]